MLQFELVESTERFASLESSWRALSEQCATASVFNSWDWQWNWWKHYGNSCGAGKQSLKIIVAQKNDAVVAILPLYVGLTVALKIRSIRELRFIGTGGDTAPDYLGLISSPEVNEDELKQLCNFVAELPAWDVACLTDMADNTDFNALLLQCFQKSRLKPTFETCQNIRFVKLEGNWEDYLASLSRNQRKQLGRRRRRFAELGQTRFFYWPESQPVSDGFDELVSLHRKRWEEKEEDGGFRSEQYLGFHKSVIEALFEKDQARLYCLEKDGEMIAMEYSYKWKNAIYSFQCGFNPEYTDYRPGQILLSYSIEQAFDEGLHEYDMLKGEYQYKESLAKEMRQTYQLKAYRSSFAARVALLKIRLSHLRQRFNAYRNS